MSEEVSDVVEETPQEEVIAPQQEDGQAQETDASQNTESDSDKEYNFRQLRDSKKQLESEVEQLREAVAHLTQKSSPPPPQEEEWDIGDDDLAEGRHVKKLYSRIEKMLKERDAVTTEDRLRSKFNDFDQVVTRENIEKLKKSEPEIYSSLISSSDLYAKGVSAYKTLKALNLTGTSGNMAQEKERAEKNHSRPMSTQSIKGSGIHEANAFANGLTPELKKQLLKEMVEASKAR